MSRPIDDYVITKEMPVRDVLSRLDLLASDAIVFLVDSEQRLQGSITDGDIRRGLINGLSLENEISDFIQPNPKYFRVGEIDFNQLDEWRDKNYKVIPVLDQKDRIVEIVNFRLCKSYLPLDAVIMAGGKGTRLKPLTNNTPKPLLKVGGKPIVEYNVERLQQFGVKKLTLSIRYLGEQLKEYFGAGEAHGLNIDYVTEEEPLGTIGAVKKIPNFLNDYILVMNSDLLTNINFEDMFKMLVNSEGDMIVATTPYTVEIPYGVVETEGQEIVQLREKPTYTYYSNAGIYIFKKSCIDLLPVNEAFNATDLMDAIMNKEGKVINYPILGYWLDIGKPADFDKAQQDVKHLEF